MERRDDRVAERTGAGRDAAGGANDDREALAGDERAGADVQEAVEKRSVGPGREGDEPRAVPGLTAPLDETTEEEEAMRRPVGMMPGGGGPAEEGDLDRDHGDGSGRGGTPPT